MIEIIDVTKKYGRKIVLNKLNFKINKGEILGFLGPNGAGKSTTMNIITGYISASEGCVKVDGIDILEHPEKVKKKIGYLPEIPPLYTDMTVGEYLKFVCRIKKVDKNEEQKHIEAIMERVKINDVKGRLIRNLSKGYKQRVGIAQALVGNPEVLILDEPTVGLDPNQIIEIRNMIKELGKEHTIMLSSHILSEVSAVCDRILIINKGEIVASGTYDELSRLFNCSSKIFLRVKGNKKNIAKALSEIENIENTKDQGTFENGTVDILIEVRKDKDIREQIFSAFSKNGCPILMMKNENPTLEEIFMQVTAVNKEA